MMRGMYSAISGLKNHQVMLDVTANDLANVNTVGFKASRVSFRDSLAQLQRSGASATTGSAGAKSAQIGLGVQLGSIDNQMTNGAFQSTGSPYDIAIQGTGWFRVSNTDPGATGAFPGTANYEYTRAGNFTLSPNPTDPTTADLATQDGWRVVGFGTTTDTNGNVIADVTNGAKAITIPTDATDVAVSPNGAITYTPGGGGTRQYAGFLGLTSFPSEAGLERASANRWRANASSGTGTTNPPESNGLGSTIGGVLEMSNVDLATEFTNMITAERGFQASSRVLSTADEMLQDLVNLKR
jgi:flagellar hook protein FlgE